MARKVSKDKKLRTSPPAPAKPPSKKDVKPSGKEKSAKPAKPAVVGTKPAIAGAKPAPPKNGKPVVAGKSVSKSPKEPDKGKKEPAKSAGEAPKSAGVPVKSAGVPVKSAGVPVKGAGVPVKRAKDGAPAKAKEAPPKRKRKSSVVRLKAYWGVFNQMLKRVAVFEYAERKSADKKASELSTNAKQPHFVQLVKEVIRDEE
jgi:hypothetical protein